MNEILKNPEKGKIRPGATLKDLIKERDYRGKNLLPLIRSLVNEWHLPLLPAAREIFNTQSDPSETSQPLIHNVILPDANLQILGVVHDAVNSDYKKTITDFVKNTKENKYFWFTEERLDTVFRVQNMAERLTDLHEYIGKPFAIRVGPVVIGELMRSTIRSIHPVRSNSTVGVNKELDNMVQTLFSSNNYSMTSDMVQRLQKLTKLVQLPEPLDMEASLVLIGDTDKKNLFIDRSIVQARQLEHRIRDLKERTGEISSVGLICGTFHTTQIEYFLLHPEYNPHKSLERVKNLLRQ